MNEVESANVFISEAYFSFSNCLYDVSIFGTLKFDWLLELVRVKYELSMNVLEIIFCRGPRIELVIVRSLFK